MAEEVELYPKIESLFDRDEKFKVKEDQIRLPEFANVKRWFVTEKVHGTNLRVLYRDVSNLLSSPKTGRVVEFNGRTANAQLPAFMFKYLQETFTVEKFSQAFPDLRKEDDVMLFGEGYGARIQKGGNYRPNDVAFRLFDVKVGKWWLEPDNIQNVAEKLNIKTVPTIGVMTMEEAVAFIKSKPASIVAKEDGGNPAYPMEGIVARSYPLILFRNGERIIFKLKWFDFP